MKCDVLLGRVMIGLLVLCMLGCLVLLIYTW